MKWDIPATTFLLIRQSRLVRSRRAECKFVFASSVLFGNSSTQSGRLNPRAII